MIVIVIIIIIIITTFITTFIVFCIVKLILITSFGVHYILTYFLHIALISFSHFRRVYLHLSFRDQVSGQTLDLARP